MLNYIKKKQDNSNFQGKFLIGKTKKFGKKFAIKTKKFGINANIRFTIFPFFFKIKQNNFP